MIYTITLPRATVQQALEALEDLGMRHFENTGEKLYADIYIALRTALEQQAEPVGEVTAAVDGAFKCEFSKHLTVGTKLYTTPPQRKPLTDEQVHAIWDHKYRGWFSRSQIEDITRAIEAAHGIKEGT